MANSHPIELEIKVLEIDSEDVERKLRTLGAIQTLNTLTYIICFEVTPETNLSLLSAKFQSLTQEIRSLTSNSLTLREQNAHLRARRQANHFELTLKYPTSSQTQVKSDFEINLNLDQGEWEQIESTLVYAGFKVIARQQKQRLSYIYEPLKLHFDIDTWPGIPTYLEIEGQSEESILAALDLLNLDKNKLSTESGEKFFQKYGVNFYSNLIF